MYRLAPLGSPFGHRLAGTGLASDPGPATGAKGSRESRAWSGLRLSCRARRCGLAAEWIAAERGVAAVVVTGFAPGGGPRTEAEQMRDAWQGSTNVELVVEPRARNTAENAAHTLPLLQERGIGSAIVVCSWIHQGRVRFFFSRLYRDAGVRTSFVTVGTRLSPRALAWELAALPLAWSQRRRIR